MSSRTVGGEPRAVTGGPPGPDVPDGRAGRSGGRSGVDDLTAALLSLLGGAVFLFAVVLASLWLADRLGWAPWN